jgi:hypothetical protein
MRIDDDVTIVVDKAELINTLKQNRETHITEYEEALAGWRKKMTAACMETSQQADKGELKDFPRALNRLSDVPNSHVKDYDRVIQMLEMDVQEKMTINAQDFSRYVQDEWAWKERFDLSNSNYR